MSDSMLYFSIALAAILALVQLWAIISVFRSDKTVGTKTLWALLIWFLPIIGLICWGVAGPRGHGAGPSSPEHSK
ncbi:PLD nuclease N-terminal domain-containing protein [Ectopseudomonas hydrolytica]|uniref:PLD nuclease N-terminal domain-containing protein n=1 Tax=Ectopseudomonas hydrolytica TaxID=2493633 RepID=A0ABY5AE32_9GAMM|nr:PLD nuclease N-terminal domain-containing protein [Pseudomonas hydrolytica]USR41997.1 PLD nuclease N-terminal domain-containing protein [Pseudomonas hydrolytica]